MISSPPQVLLNPARLSTLSALFPLPVVVAELSPSAALEAGGIAQLAPQLLTAREWDSIHHCAERRIRDFCAGRLCAHRALGEFGIVDFDLLAAADRQPLWPEALIGSITHTDGYSAAAVAERSVVAGVGIDAECVEAVHAELWPAICSRTELERLRSLPRALQPAAAALSFVAKEAFFKCQYPLAAERFDFDEVQLQDADWLATEGAFCLTVARPSRLDRFLSAESRGRVQGRFQRVGAFMIAGIALPPM